MFANPELDISVDYFGALIMVLSALGLWGFCMLSVWFLIRLANKKP